MLRRRHLGLLLLLHSAEPSIAKPPKAWFYIGWWLPVSWCTAPLLRLNRLHFFALKVNATGHIVERHGWPEQWGDLQFAVKQYNIPLDLTLTLFDVSVFEQLFSSNEAIQRLLDECSVLASQEGVAGLQLEFEIYALVRPDTVDSYRAFVLNLSKRLRQLAVPRYLSVFFQWVVIPCIYDAPTLGYVDHLVLQGYDAHWKGCKRRACGAIGGWRCCHMAKSSGPRFFTWCAERPCVAWNIQERVSQHSYTLDSASGSSY